MAEQLAFQQFGGKARAMHRDEGAGGALAAGMNCAGQHALARAAFAANQDRGLRGGRREGHVQGLAHLRRLGLQVDLGHHAADLLFELLDVRLQPPHVGYALQHDAQLIRREGLGQIIESPPTHGFHRRFDRGVGRDDDNVQPGGHAQQPRQQIEPLLLRQAEIEQGRVERSTTKKLQRLRAVAGFRGMMAKHFQRHPQRAAETGVVVNYKDIHRGHFGCRVGQASLRAPAHQPR